MRKSFGFSRKKALTLVEVLVATAVLAFAFLPLITLQGGEARRLRMLQEDLLVKNLMYDCVNTLADIQNTPQLLQYLKEDPEGGLSSTGHRDLVLCLPEDMHARLLRYPNLFKGWIEPEFEKEFLKGYVLIRPEITARVKRCIGGQDPDFVSKGNTSKVEYLNRLIVEFQWTSFSGTRKTRRAERLLYGTLENGRIQGVLNQANN